MGMRDLDLLVEEYAGYRGGERPRAFYLRGAKITVKFLDKRWTEENEQGTRRRCFMVRGDDDRAYLLYYDEHTGSWYIRE